MRNLSIQIEEEKKSPNFSNKIILLIFLLYTLSFSLLIPAYPRLLLNLTHDKSAKSSLIYGAASSLRYSFEFFSSPYLGALSDHVGRKPILIFSLASLFFEFLLVALYPSIVSIIVSKVISGICDVTFTICHAIVADIANRNDESMTTHFGSLGAVLGFGFVFGPVMGSIIASYSIQLCFAISACIALIATIIALYLFEETNDQLETYSDFNWNPFAALKILYDERNLRSLSIPYILLYLSHGVHFIWILFMHRRFGATIIDTGIYLSFSGALGVFVQGFLIRYIVPNILTEKQTALTCMVFSGLQYIFFGLAPNLTAFYFSLFIFSFNSMVSPALLSIIVNECKSVNQGAVQGSLGSLRMLTNIFSSLIFPSLFAFSLSTTPIVPGLVLYVSATMVLFGAVFLKLHLDNEKQDQNDIFADSTTELNGLLGYGNNSQSSNGYNANGESKYDGYDGFKSLDGNNTLIGAEDRLFVTTPRRGSSGNVSGASSQHGYSPIREKFTFELTPTTYQMNGNGNTNSSKTH